MDSMSEGWVAQGSVELEANGPSWGGCASSGEAHSPAASSCFRGLAGGQRVWCHLSR